VEGVVVRRPRTFFRQNGYLPECAELELTVPRGFDSPDAFRDQLTAALLELEEHHASDGRRFLGAARVRGQSPFARPARGEPRRELNPRVAGHDQWKRMEVLERLATFVTDYREAWRAWTSGVRETVFPAGTYGMRVAHGVCCHALG
jgi:putative transposase